MATQLDPQLDPLQPRCPGGAVRLAPAAPVGAPPTYVLHNVAHHSTLPPLGVSPAQVLEDAIYLRALPHAGKSPIRFGERPTSRMRDFWGNGRISGKVNIEGLPAARKVRLFDVRTGLLIAETWSRVDGLYRFDYLDSTRAYFVLAHDYVRQYNAVIADWITPEPTVYP